MMLIGLFSETEERHYIKNFHNGCVVELDSTHYSEFISGDKKTLVSLKEIGFFSKKETECLSYMIMLTNDCNLNCPYCFEHNKSRGSDLDYDGSKLILEYIKRNLGDGYASLDITFTGGEPLLNFGILKHLVLQLENLSANYGIELYLSLITNGTLIDNEIISFLGEHRFEIQITLDGIKRRHNELRRSLSLSNTYDLIVSNLYEISKYENIRVSIRVNISSNDSKDVLGLFEFLYSKFPNCRVYYDFLDVKPGEPGYIEEGEKLRMSNEIILPQEKHGRGDIYNYVEGGHCMAKNNHAITIDSNLDLYKCYSLVGCQSHKSGNIKELNCMIDDVECLSVGCHNTDCLLHEFCDGGCPYKRFLQTGDFEAYCNYEFIKKMNSLIFLAEINIPYSEEAMDNVKYFKINRQEI